MKILKSSETTIVLFFSLLCILIIAIWFRSGNLFIGAEEGIVFYRIDYVFKNMVSSVWLKQYLGMPYFNDISKQPVYSLLTWFFSLGINPFILQVATFFVVLFGGVISAYYLFKVTLEEIPAGQKAAFFGALFYLANPYVISQVWSRGLYQQFFAYTYFPLFLLVVVLFFKTRKGVFLLAGLLLSFVLSASMGNPTYFISLWVIVTFYWIYQSWLFRKSIKQLSLIWIYFCVFFTAWLVINSWWFLVTIIYAPSVYLTSGSVFENSIESLRAVSYQNPFSNVIRLYHGPHFESNLYDFFHKNWWIIVISWLSPLVVLCSVLFYRSKIYLFYGGLFLTALFICLGSNLPFGKMFEYIFLHFSPLQIFRNPYEKFGLVLLLAYSALFGLGLLQMMNFFNQRRKNLGFSVVVIILILILGIYCWPIWSGKVIAWGTTVGIPDHYSVLDEWEKKNNLEDQRILFLPYMSSLGASYHWIGGDYHGNDPLDQMIDVPVITQSGLKDYQNALKRYMGSMDLSAALAMINVKYLVERRDVISPTRDKKSTEFFTQNYYLPNIERSIEVCGTQNLDKKENNLFICGLPENYKDLSLANFIHINIAADTPGYLDIHLEDQKGLRPRWNGQKIREYQYRPQVPGQSQIVTVYLSDPTENPDTDFSQIKNISIRFIPDDLSAKNEVRIEAINKDNGIENPVAGVKQTGLVGGMDVYELFDPVPVGEFGTLEQIQFVTDFKNLFEEAKMVNLENTGFIMNIQNDDKESLNDVQGQKAIVEKKINNTKYFLSFTESGESLVVLNKSFNSEWKIIKGINENDLSGGFGQNINLLMKPVESEENHYLANGYANLWRVDISDSKTVAIVYKPQILRDILWTVSKSGFILISISLVFIWIKNWRDKK